LKQWKDCLRGYWFYAILAPLTVIVEVVLELLIPRVMARIIDDAIPASDLSLVLRLGALMVGMAILSLIFGVLSGRFASVASVGFASNLRKKLFYKIQELSFSNLDRFSTASLVTRLTTDVTNTQNAFMLMVRIMFRAPCMMIFAAIMAFTINPDLFSMFYVAVPILVITLVVVMSQARPRFTEMMRRYDGLNSSVQENLTGIRVVKAYVREDHESQKFRDASEKLRLAQLRAENLIVITMPMMMFVMYGCMVAVSWMGGQDIIHGTMTTGDLMSYISYIMQILMSLMMVAMIFVQIVLSRASFQRIREVLDEQSSITDDDADPALVPANGDIDFENVTFAYKKTPVLHDVNLHIPSGQMVGIIGATGSAKSSLVQLIARLYDVTEGKICVAGHDVRDYSLHNLRNNVAMVLQKNVLFSGTIADNLRWGNENATDEELREVCRAAQADDFISSFPDGYNTDLGQGGVNLSGGQKQRLCIARALLKKPKILILDDSTSAVDTATDARLRAALRRDRGDVTTIIIAQRIASVQDADQIIVLDDGRVVDRGTHQELLARNEIYRQMYTSQTKEAAE
jgi:ATP-binding cassette subfamily B multidrug efflux pump